MLRIELSPDCHATLKPQPFNSQAFGFSSAQLADVAADNEASAAALLEQVDVAVRERGYRHVVLRIPAYHRVLHAALVRAGYYFAESSISLSLAGLNVRDYSKLAGRVRLVVADSTQLPELVHIASQDFHHGRFLEDPFLDQALARRRHALWLEELAKTGELYAALAGDQLVGFHAEHDLRNGCADLILTGAAQRYSMLAPAIWASALMSLKARDVRTCTTMVSAANLGVLNLYQRLGFRFDETWYGFHRFFDVP